jgi:hypothetical protein
MLLLEAGTPMSGTHSARASAPTVHRPESGPGQRLITEAMEACSRFPSEESHICRLYTAHACRAALLECAGAEVHDYETVLVLSGHATSFAYHPQRYQPLYVTPDPADQVDARIAGAAGFRFEGLGHAGDAASAWAAARASLDAGRPVHGVWLDNLVFCGYEDSGDWSGRRLWVAGGWDPPGWWTWDRFDKWAAEFGAMERVEGPCGCVPHEETVREVVACMARCADCDPRGGVKFLDHALYGLEGLQAFVRDMTDTSRRPDHWNAGWLGGHCVYRQLAGRAPAARYLRRHADALTALARPHLVAAAASLTAASEEWGAWGKWLGVESGVTDAEDLRLLWLQGVNRRKGSQHAHEALRHETEAARQLRLALARIDA